MPPPRRIHPLEALEILLTRLNRPAARTYSPATAPPLYLAAPVNAEVSLGPEGARRARANCILAEAHAHSGATCHLLGTVTLGGAQRSAAADAPPHGDPLPAVWRIESGALVPPGFERAVALDQVVLVGPGRVRLEAEPTALESAPARQVLRFPAGAHLDERTRAILEAAQVVEVNVRPPFPVAFCVLGDELISPPGVGAPGPPPVRDLTSAWLRRAIEGLGLTAVELGVRDDSPTSVRETILHVRGRSEVLLLVGGASDGLLDRTAESLRRFETQSLFDGVELDGAGPLGYTKTLGIDIFSLGGKPLETAALFDTFLRPALLARLGASAEAGAWIPVPGRDPPPSRATLVPLRAHVGHRALPALVPIPLPEIQPFVPILPGQCGWELTLGEQAPNVEGRPGDTFFIPLSRPPAGP